jgi:hypothetical protein
MMYYLQIKKLIKKLIFYYSYYEYYEYFIIRNMNNNYWDLSIYFKCKILTNRNQLILI